MKVMISQPMKGLTTEQVRQNREHAVLLLEGMGDEVVDTVFTDNPPETKNEALWHLGKSLQFMANCDAVYFMKGWEDARGCAIEHDAATKYGIQTIYEK